MPPRKPAVERALQGEMTYHLDYEKHDAASKNTPDYRESTAEWTSVIEVILSRSIIYAFLLSQAVSSKLCTFSARLSVATHL